MNGDDIEIRLPWLLLNFSNPSEMMVHDDYYLHYGVEEMPIEGIYVGAASEKERPEGCADGLPAVEGLGKPTHLP